LHRQEDDQLVKIKCGSDTSHIRLKKKNIETLQLRKTGMMHNLLACRSSAQSQLKQKESSFHYTVTAALSKSSVGGRCDTGGTAPFRVTTGASEIPDGRLDTSPRT